MGIEYVKMRLDQLRLYWDGFHKKYSEIEDLRYLEDKIQLGSDERLTGVEVRSGLTTDLVEQVKAAITTNTPVPHIVPLRSASAEAEKNSGRREKFWGAFLDSINSPFPTLPELVDAQAMGLGVLKVAWKPWPKKTRRKLKTESADEYLDRQQALKRMWGPPISVVQPHALTFFPEYGYKNQLIECIEYSLKPSISAYRDYGRVGFQPADSEVMAGNLAGVTGHPSQEIKSLPAGVDTSNMVQVIEYWKADPDTGYPETYQMYINDRLVYEEPNGEVPVVAIMYFPLLGRTTSSRDPDKISLSVAEFLRHNEPAVNRTMTRMAEAAELTVKKRIAMQLPEGSSDEFTGELTEDNNPIRTSIKFEPGMATATPPGGILVDAFAGAAQVYQAMPFLELLMRLAGQHGVAPIFKGQSPGAAGSGYRDNSLYMMAMTQFKYMVQSYAYCVENVVKWCEYLLQFCIKQQIWVDDYDLFPKDIEKWPARVVVEVKAELPQSLIQEGQFYMDAYLKGFQSKRQALEKGFNDNQPADTIRERMLDMAKEKLLPMLIEDAISQVIPPPPSLSPQPTILGPDGQPLPPSQPALSATNGAQPLGITPNEQPSGIGGTAAQALAGALRAGQTRQPPIDPGTLG